jgi:hypothetical protein
VRIETDEVDKVSTAKGRTKHQDGPWRVGTGAKRNNKTSTVADIRDWIDLLKVVKPLLAKKSEVIMRIECLWSRVQHTSPSSSPVKPTTKRARADTIDEDAALATDLTSETDTRLNKVEAKAKKKTYK